MVFDKADAKERPNSAPGFSRPRNQFGANAAHRGAADDQTLVFLHPLHELLQGQVGLLLQCVPDKRQQVMVQAALEAFADDVNAVDAEVGNGRDAGSCCKRIENKIAEPLSSLTQA